MFTLMAGTAGLPHVIVRFYTVSTMKAARWSGAWALLFIGLLYLSAPAYAAFSRFILIKNVVGQKLPNCQHGQKSGLTQENYKLQMQMATVFYNGKRWSLATTSS